MQLQEYDTYSKCVEALNAKVVDALTTDNTILAGYASQPAYKGKLKLVGKTFSEEKYGVGLKKGDTAPVHQGHRRAQEDDRRRLLAEAS